MKQNVLLTRSRIAGLAALMLLGASLSPVAYAQWQWRDKNNQMHFTDVPPPSEVPDKDILKRPAGAKAQPAPAAAAAASTGASAMADGGASAPGSNNKLEAEAEARRAKAEQDEKAKKKVADEANAAARADNCARAKRQMTAIDSGMRLSRVNEKGEREILDDKGRAEEAERTKAVMASDCK